MTLGLFWGAWAAVLAERAGGDRGVEGRARPRAALRRRSARSPRCSSSAGPLVERYGATAVAVDVRRVRRRSHAARDSPTRCHVLILALGGDRRRVRGARRRHQRERRADRGEHREAPDAARARPLLGRDPRSVPSPPGSRAARAWAANAILVGASLTSVIAALLLASTAAGRTPHLCSGPAGAASGFERRARPDRARRRRGVRRRGRDRELERALPRAPAARRARRQRARPGRVRRLDGRSAASTGRRRRLGDRTLLAGGAALAAVGCVVAATAPTAAVALIGFALAGAGISLNAPDRLRRRRAPRRERGRDRHDASATSGC